MTILALDTTSESGSLALRRNGKAIANLVIHSPEGFAHLVFPAIDQLLTESGVRLAEIDCFAAANGPGSFTGVRVGLSAVKGLAEAMGKPAAGVSNLQALASFGNSARRAVVRDARRGEVYAAVYNSDLEPVVPEAVLKFSAWLKSLEAGDYELICSPGATRQLATAVAYCAELDCARGGWVDPATLDANYVRRSDAELFWRES